jgi:hypothetical protein
MRPAHLLTTPDNRVCFATAIYGAVSEGFKEAVLKTAVPKGTEGSNPSCSS